MQRKQRHGLNTETQRHGVTQRNFQSAGLNLRFFVGNLFPEPPVSLLIFGAIPIISADAV